MKRNNINYTLVGTFVFASMALLIYALARLSGHGEQHDVYYATFPNVAGIADGSPVTYDGYQVGNVQAIAPVTQNGRIHYRVQMLFRHDWKIPSDSTATIGSAGLLSGQLVDVQQGKSPSFLKPGEDIAVVSNTPLIAAWSGLASDLRNIARDDMRPALQNLNHQVDSLGNMLEHKGGTTLDQANAALGRINTAADNFGQLLNAENRQHMNSILKNGDQTISDFEQTKDDIRYAMQQTQTILSNLERASRHMNELSRRLHENPSAIFNSPAPVEPSEEKK